MDRSIIGDGSVESSELTSGHILAEAVRAIEALNSELDRTRAERDHLRALVGSRGKAAINLGGVA